jgi:hypothetical protein
LAHLYSHFANRKAVLDGDCADPENISDSDTEDTQEDEEAAPAADSTAADSTAADVIELSDNDNDAIQEPACSSSSKPSTPKANNQREARQALRQQLKEALKRY